MLSVTRVFLPLCARFFGEWMAETIHLPPTLLDMKSIHSRSLPSLKQSPASATPWPTSFQRRRSFVVIVVFFVRVLVILAHRKAQRLGLNQIIELR